MTVRIVVSRYNENVEWTKAFSNVTIYNKGQPLDKSFNEIPLNNVGREGHTYYLYIYENYDTLDDYTVFLQGNPFDHSPNLNYDLQQYIKNSTTLNFDFAYLSKYIYKFTANGCRKHGKYLPIQETYAKLFDKQMNTKTRFEFGAGAQFIVSKQSILKKPKLFYYKIIELLQTNINPIEGYVIERFHKLIFDEEILDASYDEL